MQRSEGTMTGRDAFLRNIANRLGRETPLAETPKRDVIGVPEHYRELAFTQDENVGLFVRSWAALSGKTLVVKRAEAKEAIGAYLRDVAAELGVTRAAAWDDPRLDALGLEQALADAGAGLFRWRDTDAADVPADAAAGPNWSLRSPLLRAVETCQLGIVWPDYAIANTGTLALLGQGGHGRSVSLLTRILFAIFPADRLVTRMGEAFASIRREYPDARDLASSVNLITGPSRSADIENDLTIGIHGPGKVYAVIIEP